MKKASLVLSCILLLFMAGCKKDGDLSQDDGGNKKHFVVDKIFDYHDRLVAEYFYNENNQLTLRSVYDPVNYPGIKIADLVLTYAGGQAKQADIVDYVHPVFNHSYHFKYDNDGHLVRDEVYQHGNLLTHRNYSYSNEKLAYVYNDNGDKNFFISYDDKGNAIRTKIWVPSDDNIGNDNMVEVYRDFIYDGHQMPDCGMAKIFAIEPLPQFGGEAMIEKNISANNMTEFVGGTTWIYTYNENGLPASIETKWKDIETLEPMMLKLQYREIH